MKQRLIAGGRDFTQFDPAVAKSLLNTQESAVSGQYVTQLFSEKEGCDSEMVETNGQRAIQRCFHRTSQIPLRYVEWKIPLKASSICSFMCGPDVELQLRYGSKKARRLCAKLSDSRALSS